MVDKVCTPGRYSVYVAIAVVLLFAPVFFSVFCASTQVNYFYGLLALFLATGGLALLTLVRVRRIASGMTGGMNSGQVALALMLFYVFGWMITGTPAPFIDRFFLLLGMVGLYLLLMAIFEFDHDSAFALFSVKFLVTLAVAAFFFIFVIFFQDPELKSLVKGHPPVYRHLRHLNYDLFFALPVCIFLMGRYPRRLALIASLLLLVIVAIWTAGRGMAVAFLASAAIVGLRIWRRPPVELLLTVLVVVLASLVVVVASGNDYFLGHTTMQTVGGDSLNRISSNRLAIWERSLEVFFSLKGLGVKLFGFGPDAFLRLGVWHSSATHPHNAPVQVLLEFGVLGVLVFGVLALIWLRRSLWLVLNSASDVDVLAGCLLIGGLVFSLVDGIFYHAAPLTMMVVLISFVNFRFSKLREAAEAPGGGQAVATG